MEAKQDKVTALIEVKISPQLGEGYERIAQRIYQYEEVDSLYLMSGSYDLLVKMTVNTITEVSKFVYEHLATIEGVSGTSTGFVMKKYKEQGEIFVENKVQEERIKFV